MPHPGRPSERTPPPIFNLALDLGYGSLGPFNRAFRAKTGQTPTEYRQTHLEAASRSTESPAES
jgi:AraC-like DNA-binding protein